jgi:exonuclease III
MPCKIATWNLCLGLQGKKIAVKEEILRNKIDICCMQETDIKVDFPTNIRTFPGYEL